MRSGNQERDRTPLEFVADVEVAQSIEVSDGDPAFAVEPVATDSVLDGWGWQRRACLEPGLEGLEWSASVDRSMRSLLL